MAKLPAFMMYSGDWRKDPQLSMCSPATRGVWIDLICAMHDTDQLGVISGTTEQLARVARCSTVDIDHALTDLQTTGAADVTFRSGVVTVVNRRMQRQCRERLATNSRVRKYRGNDDVTEMKRECNTPSSYSSSISNSPLTPPDGGQQAPPGFSEFWDKYPGRRKSAKEKCAVLWRRRGLSEISDAVMAGLERWRLSSDWIKENGQFVPTPHKWLNEKWWEVEQVPNADTPESRARRVIENQEKHE